MEKNKIKSDVKGEGKRVYAEETDGEGVASPSVYESEQASTMLLNALGLKFKSGEQCLELDSN